MAASNPGVGVGWRTIAMGALGILAGFAQSTLGVTIEAEQQERLIMVIFGVVSILTGGGSIVFRILAGLPTLKAAAEEIAKLKREVEEARAARKPGAVPAPAG